MIVELFKFLIGLVLLTKGSDWLIDGAKTTARRVGVSELIIGLTLTSIGTSLPEIATAVEGALQSEPNLVVGNIIGSCIVQITLILGVVGVVRELEIDKNAVHRDGPIMVFAIAFLFFFMRDGMVSRMEGIILCTSYVLYVFSLFRSNETVEEKGENDDAVHPAWMAPGLLLLLFGAELFVESAVGIATVLGIPSSIIGLTLVAFGTSVPELVISLAAIRKSAFGISVGNLIGSNITDPLFSLGAGAVAMPLTNLDKTLLEFDLPFCFLVYGVALYFLNTEKLLRRWEGAILSLIYIGYLVINFAYKGSIV